jgi:ubiquinone/menaquinone biosynthesis C-methylase UbiE
MQMGSQQLKDRPSTKRLVRKRPLFQGFDISAIVIVERGETRALAANLSTLRTVLDANCKRHDLTIVQNGGETDTARKIGQQHWPECVHIPYTRPQSYGVLLKRGIRRSSKDYILILDGANEIAPESLQLMLRSATRADMVIGRRGGLREGLRGTAYAWGWTKLAGLLFGIDAYDINCPIKLLRRSKLQEIGFLESQGEIFHTELLARMLGANGVVLECPIHVIKPVGQKLGKLGFGTMLWLLSQIYSLWRRVRKLKKQHKAESEFHDEWATTIKVDELDVPLNFTAITAAENRYCIERMGDLRGKRLLDLGCGAGETSVYFATQGANVTAVDISEGMINVVKKLADRYNVRVDARAMLAEDIKFDDNTFDIVFGNGVLHHTYRPATYEEVHRVLKPGGMGIFIEPLTYNPIIGIYRRIAMAVRTEDEKPFNYKDFKKLRHVFASVEHKEFWVFALWIFMRMFLVERLHPAKYRYWKHIITHHEQYRETYLKLRRWDDALLSKLPGLGRFAWNTVIVLRKADD